VDVLAVWICLSRGLENQQIRILQIFSKTLLGFHSEKHEAVLVASARRKRARNWSSHNN
jgi:hypothetical protein